MKNLLLIIMLAFLAGCSQDDSTLFLETNHLEKEIEKSKKIKAELQARDNDACYDRVITQITSVTGQITSLQNTINNPDPIHDNESTLVRDRERLRELEEQLECLIMFDLEACAVE